MALRDQVISAYPLAIRSKETIVFNATQQGSLSFITFRGISIFQFDKLTDAQAFVNRLNAAIAPILSDVQVFYNTEIETIINA